MLEDERPLAGQNRRTFLASTATAGVGAYLVLGELADEALAAVAQAARARRHGRS